MSIKFGVFRDLFDIFKNILKALLAHFTNFVKYTFRKYSSPVFTNPFKNKNAMKSDVASFSLLKHCETHPPS